METEHTPHEESEKDADEAAGALDEDNPEPAEDAGQRGAGAATDAIGGREEGSELGDQDSREDEQP